jgi:protein-tyrosine phosphatase
MSKSIHVVFVCLGNICRSPMAEAVMRHKVRAAGLEGHIVVDSVGTGDWHIGEPPHHGTREVLRRNAIDYEGYARQVAERDLQDADYLIAMASDNLAALRRLDRAGLIDGKVALLMDYARDAEVRDVPDPYYTGEFDRVYDLVEAGCEGLLRHIRREHGL